MLPELVGEVVEYINGPFRRVKRYYRGIHPQLGTIHRGRTGWETVQEICVLKAIHTFYIQEASCT